MLKKFYLSATITTFYFFSATASIDRITTIKNDLARITQAETDSILELKNTTTIANHAIQHFQNKLGEAYPTTKTYIASLLNIIIQSDEFITTLNEVTDLYISLILNQHMNFNDIIIDSTNYPLEDKINAILAQTNPALDEQSIQMFDMFYVVIAVIKSAELFCKKLEIKENELLTELAALETIN